MHSLLRIANILNARHKKIEKLTCNNITLRGRDDEEASKSKNKTLFKSTMFKV